MTKNQAARNAISSVCDEIKVFLLHKNDAYGNSALDPVRIFSQASAVECINVRMDDKLSRLMRGQAAGEDVQKDLLGYLILKLAHPKYLELCEEIKDRPGDLTPTC